MSTHQPLRIAVTGSSGLVARGLIPLLQQHGHTVFPLRRTATPPPASSPEPLWNVESGAIQAPVPIDALIHLAGRSVATRWTARVRKEIWESRVPATERLCTFLANLPPDRRPRALISASAVGIYGSRGDETLTESSAPGTGFLADICRSWEVATQAAATAGIRTVILRFGHVFAKEGGIVGKLATPVKLGLAGPLGSGLQWMPWIARSDLARLILRALGDTSVTGTLNALTPNPVRQLEFIRTLGKMLHRPTLLPLPAPLVKILFGQMGVDALLGSQRAVPTRLPQDFSFDFPTLENALRAELASPP